MGAINLYVEHHGCRVVVIAHDGELEAEFAAAKEKLFGQSIQIHPAVDDAFDAFVAQFGRSETEQFFIGHKEKLLSIFQASKAESLRILKHVIEDLSRLHQAISPEHLKNPAAMNELVDLFSALDIEIRSGRLFEIDLIDRGKALRKQAVLSATRKPSLEEIPALIVQSKNRYSTIELGSNLLDDTRVTQMLIKGNFESGPIQLSLNNSRYFMQPSEAPVWRIFFDFDRLHDAVIKEAIKRLNC